MATNENEYLFISDDISLLVEKLSNPDYSRNSILQKPLISKLIPLLVSQDLIDLMYKQGHYYDLFKDHISNDLFEFMFEELSGYTNTNNCHSTFIITIMLRVQTYIPSTIKHLKNLIDTLTFDIEFNTPDINNEKDIQSLGLLVSLIYNRIFKMLENFNNIEIENQSIDKQIYTEALEYLKYLINIPIKIALKAQQYNPALQTQTLLTATANYETIMELDNLKIDQSNLNNILQRFRSEHNYRDNCSFVKEYLYQIIISLIHQHIPCDCPDKLDKDIFHKLSSFQIKNEQLHILINHYLKMIIPDTYKIPLNLKLKISYIFSVYIRIPINPSNKDSILYYLDVVKTCISFICEHIESVDNIINIKSLFSLIKTILLFLTNIYLYVSTRHIKKLIHTFGDILFLISVFDKVLLFSYIDYFVDNMLDVFIDIFKGNKEVRFEVIGVFDSLLEEIIKLNNPIKQKLLGKFKKWLILMFQTYVLINEKNRFMDEGNYHMYYRVYPYQFNYWYYTEDFLLNIFFEMLPWLNTQSKSMDFLSLYIFEMYKHLNTYKKTPKHCSEDNTGFSSENVSFLSNIKFQISQKLIDDMWCIEGEKITTPSWYDQLLYGIKLRFNKNNDEEVVSEDIREGVKKLVQMYTENNNNVN